MLAGVTILWADDYWDGPLAGVALYEDRLHYFDTAWDPEADDWTSPRRFRLWRLTDEQIATEQARHEAFERIVSTRLCYHLPAEQRTVHASDDQWAAYYDAVEPTDRTEYLAIEPMGEFVE
jgi:hypothetical protein